MLLNYAVLLTNRLWSNVQYTFLQINTSLLSINLRIAEFKVCLQRSLNSFLLIIINKHSVRQRGCNLSLCIFESSY